MHCWLSFDQEIKCTKAKELWHPHSKKCTRPHNDKIPPWAGFPMNTLAVVSSSFSPCLRVEQSTSISNWGTHSTSWLLRICINWLCVFLPDWINVSCESCSTHWNVSSKLRTDLEVEYEVGLRVQLRSYCLNYILCLRAAATWNSGLSFFVMAWNKPLPGLSIRPFLFKFIREPCQVAN